MTMNSRNRRMLEIWFWTGAGLVFLMLVIGGITRLTGSGLSISDWNLIMGTLPPLNESEWLAAFDRYREFPQYRHINAGMSLVEFKGIYFWEYLHRLTGRLTGLVFLVPFLVFWVLGYFNSRQLRRSMLLFGLGAMQAAMGWIMVKSGLVDVPYVSHYRLTLHLLLAFILVGCCVWFALDLRTARTNIQITAAPATSAALKKWTGLAGIAFAVQIIWGAFTAGLDAGYIYNTFPLMNGEWLPANAMALAPPALNLVENPGTVQFMHRLIGAALALLTLGLWITIQRSRVTLRVKTTAHVLLGLVLTQCIIGILILLFHVPLAAAVAHQAVAMLYWMTLVLLYHALEKVETKNFSI